MWLLFSFIVLCSVTSHESFLSTQLWENEDIMDEFKKQLCIKRYRSFLTWMLTPNNESTNTFHFPFRVGQPEEIGGVIAFLCSEDASFITGETITVTGGIGCRL